jgi:hypothetical protein
MLFSELSLWTMLHGIVLGGGALMALVAALFALGTLLRPIDGSPAVRDRRSAVATLTVVIAVVLWLTVLTGTYILFPPYRATPPEGLTALARYPRSMVLANPETAWLHAFGMESKEHMPWIAAMLATAVAFVTTRYRSMILADGPVRRLAMTLLAVCFTLVSFTALMGIFVNKVAPLE